jgi:hypothetical protein
MTKAKFVFLSAEDCGIVVSIDSNVVACAFSAEELAEVFTSNNVTLADSIYFSSSVDFASEAGFDSDEDAHAIIDEALALVQIV